MNVSSFEEGMNAYNDLDYKTAFDIFQVLAEDHNADALNQLALMYEFGNGVTMDSDKSFSYHQKAANLDHAESQHELGWLLHDVNDYRHTEESIFWIEESATQGHVASQDMMGDLYKNGEPGVVDKNIDLAYSWYMKSANQGDTSSLESIDEISFLKEDASESNDIRSIYYYKELLKNGCDLAKYCAKYWLAWAYRNGRGVIADWEKALPLYKEVAICSSHNIDYSSDAKWEIGEAYLGGIVVKKNKKLAEKWMVKAAKDSAVYQYHLAGLYWHKNLLGQKFGKAVELYQSAIDSVPVDSYARDMAYNGLGVYYFQIEKDYEKAFRCFDSSNNISSYRYLGHLYEYGKYVNKNDEKAFQCYKKAAEGEDIEAQYCLGQMYANGSGVKQDDKLAIEWYAKSAAQGNMEAKNSLHAICYYARVEDEGKVFNYDPSNRRIEYKFNEVYKISQDLGEANDCSVKAAAIACGVSYPKVHKMFIDEGRLHGEGTISIDMVVILTRLEKANLEIFSQDKLKNMKANLGRELTSNNIVKALPKGRYVIQTKGHMAALVDGEVKDLSAKRRFRIKNIIKIPDKRENKSLSEDQVRVLGLFNAGQFYLNFHGNFDYEFAFECFKKAAEEGHVKAQTQLAKMYDQGIGVKKYSYQAARWYHNAAQCGDLEAQYEIAKKYEFGDGVDKDFEVSRSWLFTMADNIKKTLGSDWNQMFTEPNKKGTAPF